MHRFIKRQRLVLLEIMYSTILCAFCFTIAAATPLATLKPQRSVQILYGDKGGKFWSVWSGPQGLAVNPCYRPTANSNSNRTDNDNPLFDFVLESVGQVVDGSSLEKPPFPPKATWGAENPTLKEFSCVIQGRGQEGPPFLICNYDIILKKKKNNEVIYKFEQDAQFDDQIITCEDGVRYRRAWTVEY
jgi:hypothetical protein